MTKSELIEAVANQLKLPKGKAELIVNCVFDSMEAALKRGERIEIRGFGSFEIRHYKAYKGRNPRTGAEVDVRPKRLPFFKVGKELKERVNEGKDQEHAPAPAEVPSAPTPTPAAAHGIPTAPSGGAEAPTRSAAEAPDAAPEARPDGGLSTSPPPPASPAPTATPASSADPAGDRQGTSDSSSSEPSSTPSSSSGWPQ